MSAARPSRLVPAKCGHALLADRGRRRHTGRVCSECSEKRRAKERENREVRELGRGRLPDGSRFVVDYDAAAVTWSGRLETTANGDPATFYGSAPAVFVLLRQLDRLYRLATRPAKPAPPAVQGP